MKTKTPTFTFQHNEKSYSLVNESTKFGILDSDGEIVAMTDAVDHLKLSKEIKQMFKTVCEYSLYQEKTQQLLHKSLKKALPDDKILTHRMLHKIILSSTLYDFIAKCYTLDTTKELLLEILTDDFVGLYSPFQEMNKKRSFYANAIIRLIDLLNDDEWFINFFTSYMNEMTAVPSINAIKTVDWEQCIIAYLMEVVMKEGV